MFEEKLKEKAFNKLTQYEQLSLLYKLSVREEYLKNNVFSANKVTDIDYKWGFTSIKFILDFMMRRYDNLELKYHVKEISIYISFIRKILIDAPETIKKYEINQFITLINQMTETLDNKNPFIDILEKSKVNVFEKVSSAIYLMDDEEVPENINKKEELNPANRNRNELNKKNIKNSTNKEKESPFVNFIVFITIGIIFFIIYIGINNSTLNNQETIPKTPIEKENIAKKVEIRIYGRGRVLLNNRFIENQKDLDHIIDYNVLVNPENEWYLAYLRINGRNIEEDFFRLVHNNRNLDFFHVLNGPRNIKVIQKIINLLGNNDLTIDGKLGPKTKKAINKEIDIPMEKLSDGLSLYETKKVFEVFKESFELFKGDQLINMNGKEITIEIAFISNDYENIISHVQESLNEIGGKLAVDGRFGMNTQGFINKMFPTLGIKLEDGLNRVEYYKLLKAIHNEKFK